jgi:hypothetical protein
MRHKKHGANKIMKFKGSMKTFQEDTIPRRKKESLHNVLPWLIYAIIIFHTRLIALPTNKTRIVLLFSLLLSDHGHKNKDLSISDAFVT